MRSCALPLASQECVKFWEVREMLLFDLDRMAFVDGTTQTLTEIFRN